MQVTDLRNNQELLTAFVRYMPAAVAMLDREMRYLQASDRCCTDYGLNASDISGRSHYEIFPDIPERWKELHRRGLAGETLRAEEDLFERADGRRTWLRWEIRPWGNHEGLPEGILIFAEDITQRKEAEEALPEQHDLLERIVATAPGAICKVRLHPDGSISLPYASPGFRRMLPELPDLQHDATPLFTMMHPGDVERIRAGILESARTLAPVRENYRILTPARGEIWVEVHSVPRRTPDGSVNWYGFLTDITERKHLEQSLLRAKQDYKTLIDHSPDAIARVDREFHFLLVNERTLKLTGFPEEAFIGKRIDETAFPRDLGTRWVSGIRQVIETGLPQTTEGPYPEAGHETFWEVRMIPEFAADGSVAIRPHHQPGYHRTPGRCGSRPQKRAGGKGTRLHHHDALRYRFPGHHRGGCRRHHSAWEPDGRRAFRL